MNSKSVELRFISVRVGLEVPRKNFINNTFYFNLKFMTKILIFLTFFLINLSNFILVAEENLRHPPIIEQNKKYYEGEWKNGHAHGIGIYIFPEREELIKYAGQWKNGLKHGQGTLFFLDGRKYKGEWKEGFMHGHGTLILSSGAKYVGEFKNDKFNGYGNFFNKDGSPIYRGEWKDSKYNGHGTMTTSNGSKYTGELKDNIYNGHGTMTNPNGSKYTGEWKLGFRHGQGTAILPNGSKYIGGWKENKLHGHGILNSKNGALYIGEWKLDFRHGQGTAILPNGSKYVGGWKENKFHGHGAFTNKDGKRFVGEFENDSALFDNGKSKMQILTYDNGITYEGETKELEPHGYGTLTYSNGDKYEGYFKNKLRHGLGEFNRADGFKYTGEWKDDLKHGQGIATIDGLILMGEFKNDKIYKGKYTDHRGLIYIGEFDENSRFHGQGSSTEPDGRNYTGERKNGLRHGRGTLTTNEKNNRLQLTFDWKDDEHNYKGKLVFPDGTKYIGEFNKNLQLHGQGEYTFSDGSKLIGNFKNDKAEGRAKDYMGGKYEGEYKNNLRNGQGTLIASDGNRYVGEFKDGKFKDGIANIATDAGLKFIGEFKNGQMNGKGTVTHPNGAKYVGEFKNGKIDGKGTYDFKGGEKYEGEWKDQKAHGQGKLTSSDGRKYIGEFKNGLRHGTGTFTGDGKKYSGEWKDDRMNGLGTFENKREGVFISGEFENGNPQGKITIISSSKKYLNNVKYLESKLQTNINEVKIVGEWRNGVFHEDTKMYINGKLFQEKSQNTSSVQNTIFGSFLKAGLVIAADHFLGKQEKINFQGMSSSSNFNYAGGFSLGDPIVKEAIFNLTTAQSFMLEALDEKEHASAAKRYAQSINQGEGLGKDGMQKIIVKSHEWQEIINQKIKQGYVLDEQSKQTFSHGVPFYTKGLILCVKGGYNVAGKVSKVKNLSSGDAVVGGIDLFFTAIDSVKALGLFFSSSNNIINFGKENNIDNIEEIENARDSLGV